MEYLGLKLLLRRPTFTDFSKTIQKAEHSIHNWGSKVLSMAGRLVLIRATLIATFNYMVSYSIVPKFVLNYIERLCRSFYGLTRWRKGEYTMLVGMKSTNPQALEA